jgi:formamidopyrimidine-DNA glycosylase
MPELPEVETVCRQLSPKVTEKILRRIEILDGRLLPLAIKPLLGRTITRVARRAKEVVFHFDGHAEQTRLAIHLRMTGRLIFSEDPPPVLKSTRAVFHLNKGYVAFCDPRRFGTIRVLAECEPEPGLDPMDKRFTPKALTVLLQNARQEIKPWLLRQDRLVGIGNIYASEILFHARTHPERPAGSLDSATIKRLHQAILRVLRDAIKHCGTTFSDYRDATGERGAFQNFLSVYGRTAEPCRVCQRPIRQFAQQGRSTFFCNHCQPSGKTR